MSCLANYMDIKDPDAPAQAKEEEDLLELLETLAGPEEEFIC